MSRRNDRIIAFTLAYERDFHDWQDIEEAAEYYIEELGDEDCERDFVLKEIKGVLKHKAAIDDLVEKHSQDWDISRLNRLDLAILRLAVFEMLFNPEINESVAINEAVELAKAYSSDEAGRFVNGILGKISKEAKSGEEHGDDSAEVI